MSYSFTNQKEIEANKRGQITPRQYEAFETTTQGLVGARGIITLITIGLVFFVLPSGLLWYFRDSVGYGLRFYIALCGGIAYLISLPFLWQFIRNAIIEWELKQARITLSPGQVVWQGNGYIAHTPERHLIPLTGELSLIPGEYQFYYLPTSGRLLSAERTSLNIELLRDALAQTNHFLVQALTQNQQGKLDATQLPRLVWGLLVKLSGPLLILFITILLTFLGASLLPVFELNPGYANGVLLLGGLIVLGALRPSVTLLADLITGKVAIAEGEIHKTTQTLKTQQGTHEIYYYQMSGPALRFEVSEAAHEALIPEQKYAVYYLPRVQMLVAIEPK